MNKLLITLAFLLLALSPQAAAESAPPTAAPVLATCNSALHDNALFNYHTGPDGNEYRTWHAQVNTASNQKWCHYGHEHGTNPAALIPGYEPVYGYVASKIGMSEPHEGFKGFGFHDRNGHIWYITVHLGSSGLGRVCMSFHSVSIFVVDAATLETLVDVHFMGDFGPSVVNVTGEPFTPADCPNQYAEASVRPGYGVRQIPTVETGGILYEPWRLAYFDNLLGFTSGHIAFNTGNAVIICNDAACSEAVSTGKTGEQRRISYNADMGFFNPPYTGEFYTNPLGTELRDGTESDAVRQYIKPGLVELAPRPQNGESCVMRDAWNMVYLCGPNPFHVSGWSDTNLFGGLRSPN